MLGAWLMTIPFLWLLKMDGNSVIAVPSLSDLGYLIILALVCTVYANAEATKLLKQFSAFATNLVITMEPVYGILLALLFFGNSEKMEPGFYFGTILIISAVILYPIILRKITREIR
jgi:drug/metabolite transporter (DMT)-like permease